MPWKAIESVKFPKNVRVGKGDKVAVEWASVGDNS